jgi:hypothetical protein
LAGRKRLADREMQKVEQADRLGERQKERERKNTLQMDRL